MVDVEDYDIADHFIQFLYTLGQILQLDDWHDIGKFDRLHHWQYGFILEELSVLLSFANLARKMLNSFDDNDNDNEIEKQNKHEIDRILDELLGVE